MKEYINYIKEHKYCPVKYLLNHNRECYDRVIDFTKFLPKNTEFNIRKYYFINNINKPLLCKYCGNIVKFLHGKPCDYCSNIICSRKHQSEKCAQTKLERYGDAKYNNVNKQKETLANLDKNVKIERVNKQKNTLLERYGVDNPSKSQMFIDKIAQTKLEKYGNAKYNNSKQNKITLKERYGDENYNNREKSKETSLRKYNSTNIFNSKRFRKHMLEKYGVTSYKHSDEYNEKIKHKEYFDIINQKRYESMLKSGNFNGNSKIIIDGKEYKCSSYELNFYNKYLSKYDVKFQYKSEKYPWKCDFYIPEFDLYIEINGNWTHGPKPFNENDKECIELLNKLKSKPLSYINNKDKSKLTYNGIAIKCWTDIDIRKRNHAIKNNLNFLEYWVTGDLDWDENDLKQTKQRIIW